MNVLYVNHTTQKSGAGISLATLLSPLPVTRFFLLPSGCEINDALGATKDRTFEERFLCQFMTTRYTKQYPPWLFAWHLIKFPVAVRRIARLVREWKIDLVHVNETSLLAYAFGARMAGVPAVVHARTALASRPFEHLLLRRLGADHGVRIAAIDGEVAASLPPACRAVTRVIYNPIDPGAPAAPTEIQTMRASWGFSPEHVVIGQAASLHSQKGIWLILELAETLCAEFPMLRFVLAGDESQDAGEGPQLREAIQQRGLSGRVVLAGYHSRLSLFYASLDAALCLFSDALGGVGRGAYEAVLAGKPLVATLPNPETSETLKNGVTAMLFRSKDKTGILQALRDLIANPGQRRKQGAAAQAEIGGRHAPERIAHDVMELYNELQTAAKIG